MKDLFNFMGNHPILTFFIVLFITDACASIVKNFRKPIYLICEKCKKEMELK